MKWSSIVNTFKKVFNESEHLVQVGAHYFVKIEPFAATALTVAGAPEAALVLNTIYRIVEGTEEKLASQPGATKLAVAQTAIQSAALPLLQMSLNAVGKTIDVEAASNASTDAISAIVAENNAQAALQALLTSAAANGGAPDGAALAQATAALSTATAAVLKAGTEIQAAVKSVQDTPSK